MMKRHPSTEHPPNTSGNFGIFSEVARILPAWFVLNRDLYSISFHQNKLAALMMKHHPSAVKRPVLVLTVCTTFVLR